MGMIGIVKFSSGEEVIGEISMPEGAMVMENPCLIQVIDAGSRKQTKMNLKFHPYAPFSKDRTISITNSVWISEAIPEIEEAYKNAHSKIIVPDTKIIV